MFESLGLNFSYIYPLWPSGKQPENPLMLLGQYSDDEVDEESSEGLNRAASEDSSLDHDDQVSCR